jgi:hypothetical protein
MRRVFALMCASTIALAGAEQAGTITGVIATKAEALPATRVTIDQNVCGSRIADEAIVRDTAGHVANAVITLAGVKARANAPAAAVINEKCRFSPHVQIVAPRAAITTSSRDAMLHTTHAQSPDGKTLFNIALPVPGMQITRPAGAAGLVRVSCNTHPWMRAWIVVTDDMAALSGSDGRFTIANVPAGTYELRIWHEYLKAAPQKITIAPGLTTTVSLVLQ